MTQLQRPDVAPGDPIVIGGGRYAVQAVVTHAADDPRRADWVEVLYTNDRKRPVTGRAQWNGRAWQLLAGAEMLPIRARHLRAFLKQLPGPRGAGERASA